MDPSQEIEQVVQGTEFEDEVEVAKADEVDLKKQKKIESLKKAREARAQNAANKRELEILRAQLGQRPQTAHPLQQQVQPVQQVPQVQQVQEIDYDFIIQQVTKNLAALKPKQAPRQAPVKRVPQSHQQVPTQPLQAPPQQQSMFDFD